VLIQTESGDWVARRAERSKGRSRLPGNMQDSFC
jgi:hypothetical protein